MKRVLFVVVTTFVLIGVTACANKGQEDISSGSLETEKILQNHAYIHNIGLEYIKLDLEKTSENITEKRLDSIFGEFVSHQYSKSEANRILSKISPMKKLVFNGDIPSLKKTRSSEIDHFTNHANKFAKEVLNECMGRISNHLNHFNNNEVFDNKLLLDDLHTIIENTYAFYARKCSSDTDAKAIAQTLGVLYGSIEYWTNSKNVGSWSKINIETGKSSFSRSLYAAEKKQTKKRKETLSKKEWLEAVAAADAIGAFCGMGVASSPAALACSAGAALYFDVE